MTDANTAQARHALAARLLDLRASPDHWEGQLSSSALSTGTAALALRLAARHASGSTTPASLSELVSAGERWLISTQNDDGGWGDTTRSKSNISTTAIVWAVLASSSDTPVSRHPAVARAASWLELAAGATTPGALKAAILRRYGKDRTFSIPILTVLALCGRLGADQQTAWRSVPQLPFEIAALPHRWFQHLQLPVVSYALPALIAIGQVRHRLAPSRNLALRAVRERVRIRTNRLLREMQPSSGGYLEATPLTSFVVMSLAAMGEASSPVVEHGVRFLAESVRKDGSWPIDTHLATWGTTLAIGALADVTALPAGDVAGMRQWLLRQQSAAEHPFTHAAPGAWAWTPLSGGVPDADDTSSALVALAKLGQHDGPAIHAATMGARWLIGLQNRDGGVPTFCRGWGALPFDRSTPEITAHALMGWSAWLDSFDSTMLGQVRAAGARAVRYLTRCQRADGSWIPLWFGNEHVADESNPVYGSARVVLGLCSRLGAGHQDTGDARDRGVAWLLAAQNGDGGWGGARGVASTLEESGVTLSALRAVQRARGVSDNDVAEAIDRGTEWVLSAAQDDELEAAPVGLYFANLWYHEKLYPYIFGLAGMAP